MACHLIVIPITHVWLMLISEALGPGIWAIMLVLVIATGVLQANPHVVFFQVVRPQAEAWFRGHVGVHS